VPQGLLFDFTLAQLKHNKLGGIPGGHAVECTVKDSEWPSDVLLNDPSQTCDCGCGCKCDNFADVEPNAPDELRFTGGENTGQFFTGVPGESFPVDLVLTNKTLYKPWTSAGNGRGYAHDGSQSGAIAFEYSFGDISMAANTETVFNIKAYRTDDPKVLVDATIYDAELCFFDIDFGKSAAGFPDGQLHETIQVCNNANHFFQGKPPDREKSADQLYLDWFVPPLCNFGYPDGIPRPADRCCLEDSRLVCIESETEEPASIGAARRERLPRHTGEQFGAPRRRGVELRYSLGQEDWQGRR
jgi:hypothetical protein